ncbi:YbhB/YbcL family Raf kinase inhibitor-like protein [Candidatus Dependentiae bacterium]|nr:YbhB/YbcL family Raf kinase inhibitor-like protein [Candidatus Dependentiae bacterium]
MKCFSSIVLCLCLLGSVSGAVPEKFVLKSDGFKNNMVMPEKYTCDGANVSPALSWQGVPEGTESFAVICHDTHTAANNWVHWVLYNIPVGTVQLEEGAGKSGVWELGDGTFQGKTTFGSTGYGGACPPPGSGFHQYHFTIYALDVSMLDIKKDKKLVDRDDIKEAMNGHILAESVLVGTYEK